MAEYVHYQRSVPLPIAFINKYMLNANATYVKVYLYGLGKCYENSGDITNADIAEALDILETDVSKAWRYWKKMGLVHTVGKNKLVFDEMTEPENDIKENIHTQPVKKAMQNEKPQDNDLPRKTVSMDEIEKAMKINPQMKETIDMAQQLLKKTLSQREISTIYNFMEWYSMSQEMVLVLLEYCVGLEKTSLNFIEKVAQRWNDDGIDTLEKATKVLNRSAKEKKMQNKCKKMFGLDRALSSSEEKYIASWVSELAFGEAMIRTAYERTIINTGKLSMPYMNTILKSWHTKGIKNVSQIEEKEGAKSSQKKSGGLQSYEPDEMAAIERQLRFAKQKQ